MTTIFTQCAMQPADAARLADSLVFANLSGVHSHGVLRVLEYVKKLTISGVDPLNRVTLTDLQQMAQQAGLAELYR